MRPRLATVLPLSPWLWLAGYIGVSKRTLNRPIVQPAPESGEAGRSPPLDNFKRSSVDYHLPPDGQPPVDAVVQLRSVEPSAFFTMVKSLPDFE